MIWWSAVLVALGYAAARMHACSCVIDALPCRLRERIAKAKESIAARGAPGRETDVSRCC